MTDLAETIARLREPDATLVEIRNALPALLDAAERAEFMAACGQMDIDKRIAAEAERDRLAARVAELEAGLRLSRGLLEAVRDNDPNDMAADAVPVHTVWRSEARRILTLLNSESPEIEDDEELVESDLSDPEWEEENPIDGLG